MIKSLFNIEFWMLYIKCKPYTCTSWRRMNVLYNEVKYIIDNKIQGDFIECGVYKGGSCLLMAEILNRHEPNGTRKIWLYDTFTGMVKPGREDIKFNGLDASKYFETVKNNDYVDWAYSPLEDVKKVMAISKFPNERLMFIKGDVLKTIPKFIPEKIALLRLDTDWYQSTKHELIHMYPKLEYKGILIVDDYNAWQGSTKATNEYLGTDIKKDFKTIGKTGLVGIKEKSK